MAIIGNPTNIYYEWSTTNKSFIDLANYYRDVGINHYAWPLILFDPDLAGVDPFDPRLSRTMKVKILREVTQNPMYFFRNVVRVPVDGVTTGIPFTIHRANAALFYCLMMNLNIFLEQPRQTYKTISSLCWYLYEYNFGARGSEMSFLNKKFEDSKLNLARMKEIRDLLPSYLKMDKPFAPDGTKLKMRDNVESMTHPVNGNNIRTVPSARSRTAAASLMRGRTTPIIYIDEYAFIVYNKIIYSNMVPAFNTASNNAKAHNSPYGILITTTPGIMTTEEGLEAWDLLNSATPFSEKWYDLSYQEIMDLIGSNQNSNFVYIKYTYKQLGFSEKWFMDLCKTMRNDWDAILREVLLNWTVGNENSPFRREDLDTIRGLVRPPIQTILLLNKFKFDIYQRVNLKYPPIIGVDVSGGFQRDSSAITVIDSYSTNVAATMNCNYISTLELAAVIVELVRMMPNAVVNIERNGVAFQQSQHIR